ncbi:WD40-repeat-containing domain protein, partial [Thelonectria olida]
LLRTLYDHFNHNQAIAFSLDRTLVAAGASDGSIRIWDTRAGETHRTFETLGCLRGISSIAFSPEKRSIARGDGSGLINVWNITSGESLTLGIRLVALFPDGKFIASGSQDGVTNTWNTVERRLTKFQEAREAVFLVVVFPNGKFLASALGETIGL